jgi:hypothetical protein
MLEKILNLEGVELLSKEGQMSIFGGDDPFSTGCDAIDRSICSQGCKEMNRHGQYFCSTCCIAD